VVAQRLPDYDHLQRVVSISSLDVSGKSVPRAPTIRNSDARR